MKYHRSDFVFGAFYFFSQLTKDVKNIYDSQIPVFLWTVFIWHSLVYLLCIHKEHYDLLKLFFFILFFQKCAKWSKIIHEYESQTLMKLNWPTYSIFSCVDQGNWKKVDVQEWQVIYNNILVYYFKNWELETPQSKWKIRTCKRFLILPSFFKEVNCLFMNSFL